MKYIAIVSLALSLSVGAAAQDRPTDAEFSQAANAFTGCLTAAVRIGMRAKTDPAKFAEGLSQSCLREEATFRTAAVAIMTADGKWQEDAEMEVDGNIKRGREIYAADQRTFVETGKVPE